MAEPDLTFFRYEPADVDALCESLWHSLQRADIPDGERERMRAIREQLNSTRVEKNDAVIAVEDFSIKGHVRKAERHAQRALNLAYGDEPQTFWVRKAIGKAQSILISLIVNNRLK
jgi:hypothetical protein